MDMFFLFFFNNEMKIKFELIQLLKCKSPFRPFDSHIFFTLCGIKAKGHHKEVESTTLWPIRNTYLQQSLRK